MYLDNAATSFPKPESVFTAVDAWMRGNGAAYGRGLHDAADDSMRLVDECRRQIAELLDVPSATQTAFTFNCTDSLNLLLRGFLKAGDRVLTTRLEHNSVLRPLTQLGKELGIQSDLVDFDPASGIIDLAQFQKLLTDHRPQLVAISHASNVTGVVQPVQQLTSLAHAAGALVLLDAAQTAGHIPFSMRQLDVDFLAAAGHKGLLGPLGTGILSIRPGLETLLKPIRAGGTGSASESLEQPESMPGKFESGNLNMPGLAGLHASTRWLRLETVERVHQKVDRLSQSLRQQLREIPQLTLYADDSQCERTGIVTFNVGVSDCREVATILAQSFGIQCRAGLHCAPLTHETLGTHKWGGAVRFSPGYWTTEDQINDAVAAVAQIAAVG